MITRKGMYLCKNCGEIRCPSCISLNNEKCVGCIDKNIPNKICSLCGFCVDLRICKKCSKAIYFCVRVCKIYTKNNILISVGDHYCVTCYRS